MNNVWKGLVVGAVTGAAIGLTIDLLRRAGDGVVSLAELAREHGPDAAAAVSAAVGAGAERLREADLPAKLREAAHSAADSDAAHAIRQAAKTTAAAAGDAARGLVDSASERIADASS